MSVLISSKQDAWEPAFQGVERILAVGSNTSAVLYQIEPGYVSDPEVHIEEQGNYVVQGREEWFVGAEGQEQKFILEPGSLLIIEPNERHWSRVIGDERVVLLCFFGPPRPGHLQDAASKRQAP
jgi:quercetin dioxygenase-like cupin family protein